jgi:hypothetical protein
MSDADPRGPVEDEMLRGMSLARLSACVAVVVVAATGCGDSSDPGDEHVASSAAALCTAISASTTPASSAPAGDTIAVSASGTCDTVGEYRFDAWSSPTGWMTFRDWDADPNASWDTTGLPTTDYTLVVYNRETGSQALEESYTELPFRLTGTGCAGVTLSTSSPGGALAGTVVDLTAAADCGGANVEYQFNLYTFSTGQWSMLQDWSSSATYSWDTSSLAPNGYGFSVQSRIAGHTSYDAFVEQKYSLCSHVTATTSPSSSQGVGSPVDITADVECGDGIWPQFLFQTYSSSTGWSVLQDWSASPTATWDTTGLNPSDLHGYNVLVGFDQYKYDYVESLYSLTSARRCDATTLSASPPDSQTAGGLVQFTAGSTCTAGSTAEYQYYIYSPYTGWSLLQDYSASPDATWDTTGLQPGTYGISPRSRAAGSNSLYEGVFEQTYTIN